VPLATLSIATFTCNVHLRPGGFWKDKPGHVQISTPFANTGHAAWTLPVSVSEPPASRESRPTRPLAERQLTGESRIRKYARRLTIGGM